MIFGAVLLYRRRAKNVMKKVHTVLQCRRLAAHHGVQNADFLHKKVGRIEVGPVTRSAPIRHNAGVASAGYLNAAESHTAHAVNHDVESVLNF